MAAPGMRLPRRVDGEEGEVRRQMERRRHGGPATALLLDSGRLFMLLGALILTSSQPMTTRCSAEHVFVAFVLWVLGAALAMLSLVARGFPGLAGAGATLPRALRDYLLGGI